MRVLGCHKESIASLQGRFKGFIRILQGCMKVSGFRVLGLGLRGRRGSS